MKNEIKEFNFDCLGTPYQYSYGAICLTENPNQPEMLIELPSSAQRFAKNKVELRIMCKAAIASYQQGFFKGIRKGKDLKLQEFRECLGVRNE